MSAATASNTRTIYIPLLDEGVPVSRPTQAIPLPGGAFLVLPTPDYDPGSESWAFLPGAEVRCVSAHKAGQAILVAHELAAPRLVGESFPV
jgi:hypothetical protein